VVIPKLKLGDIAVGPNTQKTTGAYQICPCGAHISYPSSHHSDGKSQSKVPKLNLGGLSKPSVSFAPAPTTSSNNVNTPKFEDEMDKQEFMKVNWEELEEDPDLEITNRRPGDRRYTLTAMELQMKMNSKLHVVLDRHKDKTAQVRLSHL